MRECDELRAQNRHSHSGSETRGALYVYASVKTRGPCSRALDETCKNKLTVLILQIISVSSLPIYV